MTKGGGAPTDDVKLKRLRLLGWGVHAYTGLGLVIAALIARSLLSDDPHRFRDAFLLMAIATLIDATDGFFARRLRVKETIPSFDGRRLDDIVDFLNYTFLPLLLLYQTDLLPNGQKGWLLAPLLASAYGFCQVSAKTEDGFFLGFPSYWNLAAFYLYLLRPPVIVAIVLLVGFAAMTFLPTRYLYPSQPGRLNRLANWLGAPWALLLIGILIQLGPGPVLPPNLRLLIAISMVYPAFYLFASWGLSLRLYLAGKNAKSPRPAIPRAPR